MYKRGFTLIELLVVIAIIGILASVVLASLNSARAKARDSRRISDIKQISTALQLYRDTNGSLPSTAGICYAGWCCLGHGDAGTCWAGGYPGNTALDNSLSPQYISKLPDDPLNNTAKYGDGYMYRTDIDGQGLYATLHWGVEKSTPSAADCIGGTGGYWPTGYGNGSDYYCLLVIR
jgi:type II secretion system protein G